MKKMMAGGCLCGRVRYEVTVENDEAYLCHCRMCQKASGGVFEAFKNVKRENLRWLSEPDWYESSAIARRPFCAQCGSPLGFVYKEERGDFDLTVGSFDDPAAFKPVRHIWVDTLLPAWLNTEGLPQRRAQSEGGVAGADSTEQSEA